MNSPDIQPPTGLRASPEDRHREAVLNRLRQLASGYETAYVVELCECLRRPSPLSQPHRLSRPLRLVRP